MKHPTSNKTKSAALILLVLTSLLYSVPGKATNLALGKPVITSSDDACDCYPGADAVDGNLSSRWASQWYDPQWIDIDLQTNVNLNQVVLIWETAAAKAYQIQVSYDNYNWTTVYSTTNGIGGTNTLNVAGTGRYIRMYGTQRKTTYGYSLWEFQVYGAAIPVTGITVSPATGTIGGTASTQLAAKISPTNASNTTIAWSTSNSSTAKVDSSGLVTGVAAGTATITATTQDGGFAGSSAITDTNVSVGGVNMAAIDPVPVGGSVQANLIFSPTNATNIRVSWTSSNPAVATVSTNGLVTGVAAGSALISVTTQDGGFIASNTCTVVSMGVNVITSCQYKPMDSSWFVTNQIYSGPKLTQQASLQFGPQATRSTLQTFNVNSSVTYQTMYGFGSSFEESTVYNLLLMDQTTRTAALKLLLDPVNGSGLNLWRITIGTSDFTGTPWYTYDDMPLGQSDLSLTNFSIQNDINYGIIQILKEAQAINTNILFFASAWSPPAWMKSSTNLCGGTLTNGMYQVLAQYYRKFVQAYAAQGIPVYAMTVQNEPEQVLTNYPTTWLTPEQEIELVKAIKAEFASNGITTRLWIFDQNFSQISYPESVFLMDTNAYAAADGTAFHDYDGGPTNMTVLHNMFPAKDILFTERSAWGISGMDRIAQYITNWSSSYCSWVTMIDQNKKPNNGPSAVDPTLLIKGTNYAAQYWNIPEAYLLGQYARYVKYGAKRIQSDYGVPGTLTSVAFKNPDGSIAVVVMNMSNSAQKFRVIWDSAEFDAQLPATTMGTYIWQTGVPLGSSALLSSTAYQPLMPNLSSPSVLANGNFQIALSGDASSSYTIQSSSNLSDWVSLLTTNVPSNTSLLYLQLPMSRQSTFYRAVK